MARTYVVRSGDSLWSIARSEGVDFSSLKDSNPGLAARDPPYGINPGDHITIPETQDPASDPLQKTAVDVKPGGCVGTCPPVYILELYLGEPSGSTDGGVSGKLLLQAELAPHKLALVRGWVGLFVDTAALDYMHDTVPKTFEHFATMYGVVHFDLSQAQFDGLKKLYIWSGDMTASFFIDKGPGESLAKMRLEVPRKYATEHPLTMHPKTGEKLPANSKKLRFVVMMLESPIDYIVRVINANSRSDDIPTTAVGWGIRAQEGQPWDYKHPIRKVWGDKIRLGNFAAAVDSGAFSNFHCGYVAGAGGVGRASILSYSDWAQMASTRSWDPPEDKFAVGDGYDTFVRINGPVEPKKIKVPGAIPFTTQTVEVPVHQEIERDLERMDMRSFLIKYQDDYNAI